MNDSKAPQILVDADACPVKAEIARVAERHGLSVIYVANFGLRPSRDPMVTNVMVPQGADAADDWIVEHARENDVVVTADIPLASRVLERGAHVLGPTGEAFTDHSIGVALAMRELKQHLRETGDHSGHNPAFTQKDRANFLQKFDETVFRAKRLVNHAAGMRSK